MFAARGGSHVGVGLKCATETRLRGWSFSFCFAGCFNDDRRGVLVGGQAGLWPTNQAVTRVYMTNPPAERWIRLSLLYSLRMAVSTLPIVILKLLDGCLYLSKPAATLGWGYDKT